MTPTISETWETVAIRKHVSSTKGKSPRKRGDTTIGTSNTEMAIVIPLCTIEDIETNPRAGSVINPRRGDVVDVSRSTYFVTDVRDVGTGNTVGYELELAK
jgi:hypothetical protein